MASSLKSDGAVSGSTWTSTSSAASAAELAVRQQCFDGNCNGDGADRYLRESIFGAEFEAKASQVKAFFDKTNSVYQQLA
jgi:hypothetical protein